MIFILLHPGVTPRKSSACNQSFSGLNSRRRSKFSNIFSFDESITISLLFLCYQLKMPLAQTQFFKHKKGKSTKADLYPIRWILCGLLGSLCGYFVITMHCHANIMNITGLQGGNRQCELPGRRVHVGRPRTEGV